MSFGIEIKNPQNELLIDQRFNNFSLHSSGTFSGTTTIVIPPSDNHKLFVRPNTDGAWVEPIIKDYRPATKTDYQVKVSSGSCSWLMYTTYGDVPAHTPTYGMEIFDTNGTRIYDSDVNQMEIEAKYRYNRADAALFLSTGTARCTHNMGAFWATVYNLVAHTVTKTFPTSQKRRYVSLLADDSYLYVNPITSGCGSSNVLFHPIRFSFTNNNTLLMTGSTGQQDVWRQANGSPINLNWTWGGFWSGQDVEVGLY